MKGTAQEQRIAGIIEPVLRDIGFDMVQVRILGSAKLQTLQIMAEDPESGTLDLDACTEISRAIAPVLDVEDPISGSYQLEITSPGLERPLVRPRDFEKALGRYISVETETPDERGQKKFKGVLTTIGQNLDLSLSHEHGVSLIPMAHVCKARLVLTDDQLKAALSRKGTEANRKDKDQHPQPKEQVGK